MGGVAQGKRSTRKAWHRRGREKNTGRAETKGKEALGRRGIDEIGKYWEGSAETRKREKEGKKNTGRRSTDEEEIDTESTDKEGELLGRISKGEEERERDRDTKAQTKGMEVLGKRSKDEKEIQKH